MNKKAVLEYIGVIVMLTVSVIIIANVLVPEVQKTRDIFNATDTIEYFANATHNVSYELTYDDLYSLTITGLVLNTNYTTNLSLGTVNILNGTTATGNYTATYDYYPDNYLTSAGDRAMMGVIVLVFIIGVGYVLLKLFGAV